MCIKYKLEYNLPPEQILIFDLMLDWMIKMQRDS